MFGVSVALMWDGDGISRAGALPGWGYLCAGGEGRGAG